MTAKRKKTRPVLETEVRIYLAKAEEFLRKSRVDLMDDDVNAAGLLAVHAAISASDAVTGHYGKSRSSGDDHNIAAALLRELAPPGADEWNSQAARLGNIIAKKNLVAYEGRHLTKKESSWLVAQAERFVSWAREVVPL